MTFSFANDEFRPEHIELTPELQRENCERIAANIDITSEAPLITAQQYRNDLALMLQHLRGSVFTTKTTTQSISGLESGLSIVATNPIPAGTLLGPYFGEITTKHSSLWKANSYIVCGLTFRDSALGSWQVIGKLDGKLTPAATMNHAYSATGIARNYVFMQQSDRAQVCSANVMQINLCFIIVDAQQKQHTVTAPVFITKSDISKGEPLVWSYDEGKLEHVPNFVFEFFRPNAAETYWGSRGRTPLLITNKNTLINTQNYFPSYFNIRVTGYVGEYFLTIPYRIVPQLFSNVLEQQARGLSTLQSKQPHVHSSDLDQIKQTLRNTGFIHEAALEHMQRLTIRKNSFIQSSALCLALAAFSNFIPLPLSPKLLTAFAVVFLLIGFIRNPEILVAQEGRIPTHRA